MSIYFDWDIITQMKSFHASLWTNWCFKVIMQCHKTRDIILKSWDICAVICNRYYYRDGGSYVFNPLGILLKKH